MQRIASIALVLGAMGLAALFAWPPGLPAPAPTIASMPHPAASPQAARSFFSEIAVSDADPPIEIALTDQQELIADSALLEVFNFYLLKESGFEALKRHLQGRLPASASEEALRIATSYQAYMVQHDRMLAAQNFSGPADPYRLDAWIQQRERLRRDVLGERVAQAWFANEDAYLMQAMDELRRAPDTAAAPPAGSDLARHQQHMQQVLTAATRPYATAPPR
jgi:hypothetical protein